MSEDTFPRILSTSIVAHILFILALMMTPLRTERLAGDLFDRPGRFESLIVRPPDPKTFEARFEVKAEREPAAPPEDEAGRFGRKEADAERAAPSETGAPVVDVRSRESDMAAVAKTGLFQAFARTRSDVLGPGGVGHGVNEALGGLDPAGSLVDARGLDGLSSRGVGPGGGGELVGGGVPLGTVGGRETGPIALAPSKRTPVEVIRDETRIEGGLDREVIARIVGRHRNEIRYCYERELQRDPGLHGRVAILWVIDGTGAVSHAAVSDSSLENARVETCILERVRRWRFPEPRGGGVVRVTYPWILSPRG